MRQKLSKCFSMVFHNLDWVNDIAAWRPKVMTWLQCCSQCQGCRNCNTTACSSVFSLFVLCTFVLFLRYNYSLLKQWWIPWRCASDHRTENLEHGTSHTCNHSPDPFTSFFFGPILQLGGKRTLPAHSTLQHLFKGHKIPFDISDLVADLFYIRTWVLMGGNLLFLPGLVVSSWYINYKSNIVGSVRTAKKVQKRNNTLMERVKWFSSRKQPVVSGYALDV